MLLLSLSVLSGCDDGSGTERESTAGPADGAAAASPADAASNGPDSAMFETGPFNGTCDARKWAGVSDACWACICSACPAELDACNESCFGILNCAFEERCLVRTAGEMICEGLCVAGTCLVDPAAQSQVNPMIALEVCLLNARGADAGTLRTCEQECGATYSGDVCERFPAP